jgi:H+/Cl- antiporter ClcA
VSSSTPAGAPPPDPAQLLRSRSYIAVLVLGALIGVPVAAVAYFYLKVVAEVQTWVFTTLPGDLGFSGAPALWPLLPLTVSGVLVGLTLRYLPGTGGHKPAEGFKSSGPVRPIELPGIALASFATLSLGVVLGPEAPLIAIGSGLGVLAVHLLKRDAPETAVVVIGAAGSFAAVSTLLGSPLVGGFLLMEAAGIGGGMMGVILIPGMLAAGVGTLIFVGLDNWTGYGTFSLSIPNIPPFTTPTLAEFLWAIGIGLAAAVIGTAIGRPALRLQPIVERRMVVLTPVAGLGIGAAAVVFGELTTHSSSEVLFSGQNALPSLIEGAAGWTVGALVLLMICKGVAYSLALSCFRGGPTFPGMFIGAAGGIALSHLPGLPMIAGAAMGIGAMTVAMLGLPLTSVLLATLFLSADGLALTPLVIVAVVVAYVASAHLVPAPKAASAPAQPSAPPAAQGAAAGGH